jgi:hypothetical protein
VSPGLADERCVRFKLRNRIPCAQSPPSPARTHTLAAARDSLAIGGDWPGLMLLRFLLRGNDVRGRFLATEYEMEKSRIYLEKWLKSATRLEQWDGSSSTAVAVDGNRAIMPCIYCLKQKLSGPPPG